MNNLEQLLSLLDAWGVPYEVMPGKEAVVTDDPDQPPLADKLVRVGDQDFNGKVTGYGGFYTDFEFDASDQFIRMGAWE